MNLFSAKFFVFLLLPVALSIMATGQTFYGTNDAEVFREGRSREFRNKKESPLKEEDFTIFKGLNYFSVDKKFRLEADFARTSDEKYFQMSTSSGKTKKYIKFGVLKFKLNGMNKRSLYSGNFANASASA